MEKRFLIGLVVVMLAVCPAFGGSITDLIGLFNNTGVGTYTGYYGPSATAFTPVVTATETSAGWMANTATSSWIGPATTATGTPANYDADVAYAYRLNFNLTGYIPSTFHLNYGVTGDDAVAVFLNGTNIVSTFTPSVAALTSLSLTGAGPGMNSLIFMVTNVRVAEGRTGGNPTGVNVRYTAASAEAEQSGIPEPATVGLIGAGLLALGLFRKRR